MSEPKVPQMKKWPFLVADAVAFLGCYLIYTRGSGPWGNGEMAAFIVCGSLGMFFLCFPFYQEYRLDARFAEADQLARVTEFMTQLGKVKNGVTIATAHLETAQDYAEKTIEASKEIAERMTDEAKAFADFMAKANDTEKAHLELEVEKLKRGESEWIKTLMTTLDETFRLCDAASRSGNTLVVETLTKFQSVCRAAAGRVGLVAFEPEFGEPFDSEKHVVADSEAVAPEGARVGGTVAPGYTYMRRTLRPAAVELQGGGIGAVPEPEDETAELEPEENSDVADDEAEPDFDDSDEGIADDAGSVDPDDEALAEDPFADDENEVEDQEDGEDEGELEPDGEDADFVAQQLSRGEEAGAGSDDAEDGDDKPEQRELL
jgi:molecular chaperone GrpE (heat shock protein)